MTLLRTSYATVIGLALQSYRFEQSATRHLLEMNNAALKAANLDSKSESDAALSVEKSARSEEQATAAEALSKHALVLEEESKEQAAAAEADRVSSAEFTTKMAEEESQAGVHEAAATAEEIIYDTDTKKALAEAAEAAELEARTEADGLATGFCEFIPGLDVLCDVIGGLSAVRMETQSATIAGQSVLDFAEAATAKEQEDANIAASEALNIQVEQDEKMVVQLQNKAAGEQARSEELAAEAKKEQLQAKEKMSESEEEAALSKQEKIKADTEMENSSTLWKKSIVHGLAAFWDVIWSTLISFVALLFFVIRVYVAILVPCIIDLTSSLPVLISRGDTTANANEVIGNAFFRQISYFLLHCGTFFIAIITFFPSFKALGELDVRSKGGIILMFSFYVACFQSFLLHVLPDYNRTDKRHATSKLKSIMWRACGVFLHAIVHFVPLVIMETISLWVIFGENIFTPIFSPNTTPFVLGLLFSVLIHIYLFERVDDNGLANDCCGLHSISNLSINGNKAYFIESDSLLNVEPKHDLYLFKSDLSNEDYNACKAGNTNWHSDLYSSNGKKSEARSSSNTLSSCDISLDDGSSQGRASELNGIKTLKSNNYDEDAMERHVEYNCKGSEVDLEHYYSVIISACGVFIKRITSSVKDYFSALQFPFEMLVICCTFTLLKSSLPRYQKLVPVFQHDFISSHHHWYLELIGVLLFIGFMASLWCLYRAGKNKSSTLHLGLLTGETLRRQAL